MNCGKKNHYEIHRNPRSSIQTKRHINVRAIMSWWKKSSEYVCRESFSIFMMLSIASKTSTKYHESADIVKYLCVCKYLAQYIICWHIFIGGIPFCHAYTWDKADDEEERTKILSISRSICSHQLRVSVLLLLCGVGSKRLVQIIIYRIWQVKHPICECIRLLCSSTIFNGD